MERNMNSEIWCFQDLLRLEWGPNTRFFWLSRRQQMFGYVPLRAAYHAYEAKIMAESSPHVNEHLDIIVATDNEQWYSSTHRIDHRFPEHPEINIKNLQRMWKKYSTRDTSNVGLGEIEIKRASRRSVWPFGWEWHSLHRAITIRNINVKRTEGYRQWLKVYGRFALWSPLSEFNWHLNHANSSVLS